ncbi:MAG: GIY-YIG nuclease family protein [Pedobacter sp.]|uniref:GIY-YIG nuclease family protein n=1 Tax=Pedobacter sp. TaxID=1411316 RepID=UPI0035656784
MIQINIPELSKLTRYKARPCISKFHPPTGKYQLKNEAIPKISGIYAILNKSNNIIYIGQSVNIQSRIAQHLGISPYSSAISDKDDIEDVVIVPTTELLYSIDGIERIYIDMYQPKYNDIPTENNNILIEMQRAALKDIPLR